MLNLISFPLLSIMILFLFTAEWKITILFLVVLFLMIIVFSTLNVPYAWGGIFITLVGYVLIKHAARNEQARASAEGRATQKSNILKGSIHGPVSVFMILGGLGLAVFDISRNGKTAYATAKHGTTTMIASIGTGPSTTLDNINRAMMGKDLAQKSFADEKRLIKARLNVETDAEKRQLLTRMEKAIDSIEDEASLKTARAEFLAIGVNIWSLVNEDNPPRTKNEDSKTGNKDIDSPWEAGLGKLPSDDERFRDVYKINLRCSLRIGHFAKEMKWNIKD